MSPPAELTLVPRRRPAPPPARRAEHGAFVGRTAELARVLDRVACGARLISLLGPPGIGKTTLAQQVAFCVTAEDLASVRVPRAATGRRALDVLPPRQAWFCDVSNQRTDAEFALQLLALVGEPGGSPADVGPLLATLGPSLVVLDNFEQLTGASPWLSVWSREAPEVVFLVTSRERLAIDGEEVIELEPLGVPARGAQASEIAASAAVTLFRLRAEAAGAAPSDDLEAIAEIVRRLDGLPLAIELAAARTRILPAAELAQRLSEGRSVLSLGKRAPARHRTLADAIAWSWELLSAPEQRALACCSVFAGSFELGAAERVLGRALGDEAVIDCIAALRDKSLVHAAGGRLGLYLSIRQFAAARLAEGEVELRTRVAREHARCYASLAARFCRARLLLTSIRAADLRVRDDADNMLAALRFLDEEPPSEERSAQRGELASALCFLGALPEHALLRALEAVLHEQPAPEPTVRAVVHLARQQALVLRGRFDAGRAEADEVIDKLDVSAEMRAAALVRRGIYERENGEPERAQRSHERAELLIARDPPSCLRGINTACLGRLACDFRHVEAARQLNEEAVLICEQLGERWLAALGRANIAQLEQDLGDFARAEALLERAIERFAAAGEPQYEGFYAAICGGLYLEWGKLELARRWYVASERPVEAVSRAFSQVVLHGGRAALEALDDNAPLALVALERARRCAAQSPGRLARLLLEVHAATVELALGLASPARVDALATFHATLCEGATAAARVAMTNLDTRFALRILGRALGRTEPVAVLVVERDGRAFTTRAGSRVDLGRRSALRRLLWALARAHGERRGRALGAAELFGIGWPGQNIQPDSAATRVRVAIATLRKLGLRDILLTAEDGYLLEPAHTIRVEAAD